MYKDHDFYRYRFYEGKHTWKLLFGIDVVKALPQLEESDLYLPATEEFKAWWALLSAEFSPASPTPEFKRKYLWYKAISEASRIYLLVCHNKKAASREAALCAIKDYLPHEYQNHIDRVQGYLKNLTSKEHLVPDELMGLFISLARKTFKAMELKVYGDSKGKMAVVKMPGNNDTILGDKFTNLVQEYQSLARREIKHYLDHLTLLPQFEFGLDILSNSDIDSFYLALIQNSFMPINKLREFRSIFTDYQGPQRIEPFIVSNGTLALSLQPDEPYHCIKSPRRYPLFFSLLQKNTAADTPIHCYLPPNTFEETISKRLAKINETISNKNIYKMKTLDFLRFFWGSARTKLIARSLDSDEIHIPLNSRQILGMLLQSCPEDSDWLKSLHMEYTKELLGEENESYRFYSRAIQFLTNI